MYEVGCAKPLGSPTAGEAVSEVQYASAWYRYGSELEIAGIPGTSGGVYVYLSIRRMDDSVSRYLVRQCRMVKDTQPEKYR